MDWEAVHQLRNRASLDNALVARVRSTRDAQSRQTADYLLSTDPYRAWQEAAGQLLQKAVASRERAEQMTVRPAPAGVGHVDWIYQAREALLIAQAEERGVRAAIELIPGYGSPQPDAPLP